MLCPLGENAALTGYLKIDNIPGESQRADHEREIDVLRLEWKIETDESSTTGVRNRWRAKVTPLKICKCVDKATPALALATLSG